MRQFRQVGRAAPGKRMIPGDDDHRPQLGQGREGQPLGRRALAAGHGEIRRPLAQPAGKLHQRQFLLADDHARRGLCEAADQARGIEGRKRPEHAQTDQARGFGGKRQGLAFHLPGIVVQALDMVQEQPSR